MAYSAKRVKANDPKVLAVVRSSLLSCMKLSDCASAIRINRQTWWAWMKRGEAGDPEYLPFYNTVKDADHEAQEQLLRTMQELAVQDRDFRATRFLLRARYGFSDAPDVTIRHVGNTTLDDVVAGASAKVAEMMAGLDEDEEE